VQGVCWLSEGWRKIKMQDTIGDLARVKDASSSSNNNEHDALINRVAQEMCGATSNSNLMSFEKAPDNKLNRMALAGVKGIADIPMGIVHAVDHDIHHPLETLGTLGMGAGMAVVLKTVLPDTGIAGKIAGAAIGTYFTVQAVKPVMEGFKAAGEATTMKDLNLAAQQIGDAGGNYIVSSAVAGAGYKLGAYATDKVLATETMKPFVEAKANFYDKLDTNIIKMKDAAVTGIESRLGLTKPAPFQPEAYGVIPPYMLEELAKRSPENADFVKAYKQALEMQQKAVEGGVRPRGTGEDFHGAREVYDAKTDENLPGVKARFEGEKPTGNPEVDQAYDFTGATRDFYLKEYGRNSIDGKGMKYVSTVNYGQNYENAFWNGSQMTYGKPGPDSPFKTFMILDVAGHEITHGVTEMESNMAYRGQSGALNESLSDVYGNLIKQYARGQSADKADWLVGEGIWKENVKGRGLRDMLNPGTAYDDPAVGKDPQPAHMKDYYKTYGDNGGVHYNSGIPNKAFATFAQAVGGNAWEDPGHIWYNARKAAGSNPSFAEFAFQTLEAAKSMGKNDLVPKLQAAWDGVGVKPAANAPDTSTPGRGGGYGGDSILSRLFHWNKAS
jgi:hypothetical protein